MGFILEKIYVYVCSFYIVLIQFYKEALEMNVKYKEEREQAWKEVGKIYFNLLIIGAILFFLHLHYFVILPAVEVIKNLVFVGGLNLTHEQSPCILKLMETTF